MSKTTRNGVIAAAKAKKAEATEMPDFLPRLSYLAWITRQYKQWTEDQEMPDWECPERLIVTHDDLEARAQEEFCLGAECRISQVQNGDDAIALVTIARRLDGPDPWELLGTWVLKEIVADILEEKFTQPVETLIDKEPNGIMPAMAGASLSPGLIIRADPATLPSNLALLPPDSASQLFLPGIGRDVSDVPALMLALLDAGAKPQRGAGAPLRDRYYVEALMLASRGLRNNPGERYKLVTETGDMLTVRDVVEWSGWSIKDYRPFKEKSGISLAKALRAVNSITIPIGTNGGWLHCVFIEALEGRSLNDRLAVTVRLPLGSDKGAQVDRAVLRQAGKVSAVAWRIYLGLCFAWNRISRNGRNLHYTEPDFKRDAAGYLVDARGNVLTNKKGEPQSKGSHRKAVTTGDRVENNFTKNLYSVTTFDSPSDLVDLAYPLGFDLNHKARTEDQCVKSVLWLAGERGTKTRQQIEINRQAIGTGGVKVIRNSKNTVANPHGFPWTLVAPEVR